MSSRTLYRIGGVAVILYTLFDLRSIFFADLMGERFDWFSYRAGIICMALVSWALYHLYASTDRNLSLAGLIPSVSGAVVLLVNTSRFINFPDGVFTTAWVFNQIIPILLFGILAYRYPQLGMPRALGVVGILFVFLYFIFYRIFSEVNFGFVDNFPLILGLTWQTWTGIRLFSGSLPESPQGITIWGADKLKSVVVTLIALPRPSWKMTAGIIVTLIVLGIAGYQISHRTTDTSTEEDSKVISAENAEQLDVQPQSGQQLETQPGMETLAEWQAEGVNGTIEDYFFNAEGSLMGINTPGGMYLIDLNTDMVTHLLPEQPYQHRLKAISPDGKFLITEDNESERMRDQGQYQQRLYLWDATTQAIIQPLDVALDYSTDEPYPYLVVLAMEFSPDGKKLNALIDVSDDSGEFVKSFVWNMPEGQLLTNQIVEDSDLILELVGSSFVYQREYDNVAQVRFLPDGDQVVISNSYVDLYSAGSLAIFSFPEGKNISNVPLAEGDLRIAANGNAFVTLMDASNGNEYSIWELPTGHLLSTIAVENIPYSGYTSTFDSEYSYTISPSGNLLAGRIPADENKALAIVKNDGTTLREIPISGEVLAFSPTEEYVVVHDGASLMFVDIATGEVSKTIALIQPIGGLAINPVLDMMAVSHLDALDIYEISSQVKIRNISLKTEQGDPSMPSISFSADGKYLISRKYDSYSGSEVNIIWDVSDWSIVKQNSWEGDSSVTATPWLFQPLSLLVTPYYGQLAFFDINNDTINPETGLAEPTYVVDGAYRVVNFQVSPDQKHLAYYGEYQGSPQFLLFDLSKVTSLSDLDTAMQNPVLRYPVEWVGGGATAAIAFSPASDFLAVYDIDAYTYVIDLATFEIKWKIIGSYAPSHLLFSSDAALLFADGPVYDLNGDYSMYTMDDPKELPGFPLAELPIVGDFIGTSQNGEFLISVSTDGVFTYWGIP